MSIGSVTLGFYGKIPSRGDFVQKGLPKDFVRKWDEWMTHVIPYSQQKLLEQWDAAFMTAPLWRFYLAPGVCGADAACGVMLPSVDQVGRTFTLVLGRIGATTVAAALSQGAAPWFERVEALAMQILEQQLAPDTISQLLHASEEAFSSDQEEVRYLRSPIHTWATPLAGLDTEALLAVIGGAVPAMSVWWSQGSDLVEPSTLWCRGLPSVEVFPSMLAGQWGRFGWRLPKACS